MLVHAPAPVAVDGLLAVPIHILQLRARVVLDAATGRGRVDALMRFRVGPTSGCPLFDLRQSIDAAWLDGQPIAPARVGSRGVGEGPYATVRVLDLPQPAGSTHTLRFSYRLAPPRSDLGGAYPPVLSASSRRVRWSFGMGDLFDGRHLEMWFPSNLPFDQFPFELALAVTGAEASHTLITNGATTTVGQNAWHITFPAWFSSVSAMVELRPTDELDHAGRRVVLARTGRPVLVDVWKVRGRPGDLPYEAARVARLLDADESRFGPYPVGRCTCFFHDAEGGMEYAGATTTSSRALAHEVLHSWFARGVMPASDADGWWDEGFTTWVTAGAAPTPLDLTRPPVELCSRRPFQRHTEAAAYVEGSRLFGGLAALTGRTALLRSMGALFRARARTCLSTAELEQHLVLDTGAVQVVDAFHRFVYGFGDPSRGSGVRFDRLWVSDEPDGRRWINARVSLGRDAEVCRHFLLLFSVGALHVGAVAGFDLGPGRTRVLRVPFPTRRGADQSAADSDAHLTVTGAVHARLAHPSGGADDHRDRTVMSAEPGMTTTVVQRRVRRAGGAREPAPAG